MEEAHLDIYVREVGTQCSLAGAALVLLSDTPDNSPITEPQIWVTLQSFLSSCAMLAKLLWPMPPTRNPDGTELTEDQEELRQRALDRGAALRAALKVKSPSPLERRRVRNGFEHIDERLDHFLRDQHEVIVDMHVGPKSAIDTGGDDAAFMRNFDPVTSVISVLDEDISIDELSPAITQVNDAAMAWVLEYRQRHPL